MGSINNLEVFESEAALRDAAKQLLVDVFTRPSTAPFAVMLPGGSTPLPIYRELANHPVEVSPHLHIFFSDDRMVPAGSPDSNYGNARPMLEALGLVPDRTMRVDGDRAPAEAAALYSDQLAHFIGSGGRIPLGLLGLGADGHTASLFTLEHANSDAASFAMAVERTRGPHRVSVTASLLAKVDRVIFLVAGPSKRAMVQTLKIDPDSIPAGAAVKACRQVDVWTDTEAGGLP